MEFDRLGYDRLARGKRGESMKRVYRVAIALSTVLMDPTIGQ